MLHHQRKKAVGRCTGDDLEKSGVLESLQSPDKIPVETITVDLPAFDEVRMIEPPQMIGATSTKNAQLWPDIFPQGGLTNQNT